MFKALPVDASPVRVGSNLPSPTHPYSLSSPSNIFIHGLPLPLSQRTMHSPLPSTSKQKWVTVVKSYIGMFQTEQTCYHFATVPSRIQTKKNIVCLLTPLITRFPTIRLFFRHGKSNADLFNVRVFLFIHV